MHLLFVLFRVASLDLGENVSTRMAKVIDNTHGERILRQEAAVPVIELLLRDSGKLDRETPGLGLAAEADGRDVRLRERDAIMVFLLAEQRGDSRIFAPKRGLDLVKWIHDGWFFEAAPHEIQNVAPHARDVDIAVLHQEITHHVAVVGHFHHDLESPWPQEAHINVAVVEAIFGWRFRDQCREEVDFSFDHNFIS